MSGRQVVNLWKDAVADLMFPPVCIACGDTKGHIYKGLCLFCTGRITNIRSPLCSCCGVPFETDAGDDHLCSSCLIELPPYRLARSLTLYEEPVRQLLHNLKYRFDTASIGPLLKIARNFDFSAFRSSEVILPVPLHVKRLKQRGMNQSLVLAKLMFPDSREKIFADVLLRERATASQTLLTLKQRKKNLKNAFKVKSADIISNKCVCLVDDVFTTGATAVECSRQLLLSGAAEVRVVTVARVKEYR